METPALTAKALQTREHILATSLKLFAEKGFEETTLREIAREAKVSLGLTYRYFSGKDELVLALYERLSDDAIRESQNLPPIIFPSRFAMVLNRCLDGLAPHRRAMTSLFSVGLNTQSELAVLGPRSAEVRRKMWELYRMVLTGASDAPKDKQADQMATLLYAAHLLIVLFWLQDRSEEQQRTRALVRFAEGLLKKLRPAMKLPMFSKSMEELSKIIGPMFGPA